MGMDADAKMIWAWAATHCEENETLPEDMTLFLGFSGTMDRQGDRYEIQPPPLGTKSVYICLSGEDYGGLEVELTSVIQTAELEPYLGASHSIAAGRLGYWLAEPKAPNICSVTVETEGGLVKRVKMHRELATGPNRAAKRIAVAFNLGYAPARLYARHGELTMLAKLAAEPGVQSDAKLAHAVNFTIGAVKIEQRLLTGKLDDALANGRAAGLTIPDRPVDPSGWDRFDAIIQEQLAQPGDAGINLAYWFGRRARELYAAWAAGRQIAFLYADCPHRPAVLAEVAQEMMTRVRAAWAALASKLQGAPTLEKKRAEIEKCQETAPTMEVLTHPIGGGKTREEVTEWLKKLDACLEDIWLDLPAIRAAYEASRKATAPLPLDEFLRQARVLAARGWLTTLKLAGAGGRVAELAAVPELAKVVVLEMRKQHITDVDIQALVASPYVGGLRGLMVGQNDIREAGVEALAVAASTTLQSLESVELELNHAGDPADRMEFYDETNQECVSTEEGRALEAKYGRIKWLHPYK